MESFRTEKTLRKKSLKSLKSVTNAKYVLIKMCDEHSEELKEISQTAGAALTIIKTPGFWSKMTNVIKLIEYPVNIIGKANILKFILETYFNENIS